MRKGERSMTVLTTIGRTWLIPLRHIVPEGSAGIVPESGLVSDGNWIPCAHSAQQRRRGILIMTLATFVSYGALAGSLVWKRDGDSL